MTDFAEAYARGLLLGIARYAESVGEAWNICRLPLSIRDRFGIKAVVEYAYTHHADAVIGQFNPQDDVSLFTKQGILVLAQDFKSPFTDIPANIANPEKWQPTTSLTKASATSDSTA